MKSKQKLSTVNVIELNQKLMDNAVLSLTAFPDTQAGNPAAEQLFLRLAKSHGGNENDVLGFDIESGVLECMHGSAWC